MAKILLACYPIPGHLHPNLAVGDALRRRDHQVMIYSGEMARDKVQQEGFEFSPYQEEMDKQLTEILLSSDEQSRAADVPVAQAPLLKIQEIRSTLWKWFLSTIPQQIDDLRAICRMWQPDLLVTDISLFGPILVLNETEDIPVAGLCVLLACPVPGKDAPTWGRGLPSPRTLPTRLRSTVEQIAQNVVLSPFRAEASKIRRQYGLPPLSDSIMAQSGRLPLLLVTSTPALDYNRSDLPDSVRYVGPCLWHRSSHEPPADWLKDLGENHPVVHVTEGTVHTRQPLVLRAAAQGLGGADMDVVMTTGNLRAPAELDLGTLAPNIRIERYVPHGDLFPYTDVVVTTGGAGTVATALTFGIPLVIVPTGWDLPENAQRIVEAGAGVRIQPKHCSPQSLRAAVETVLGDPKYRNRAQEIGAALNREGGPARAAELLEGLLT